MSMTYTDLMLRLAQNIGPVGDGINWLVAGAAAIDAGEQRMYRELGLMGAVVRQSFTLTANARNFTLPVPAAGRYSVVYGLNVVTPVGSDTTNGALNSLTPTSVDHLLYSWPSNTAASALTIPEYFAMVTDQTGVFGPPPGDAYNCEAIGEIRPNTLTALNPTTILSLYFPDIFLAACMVHLCKHGANEAAAAQLMGWEQTYQTLKGSAEFEEGRKRFAGSSWSSRKIEPGAQPQRG